MNISLMTGEELAAQISALEGDIDATAKMDMGVPSRLVIRLHDLKAEQDKRERANSRGVSSIASDAKLADRRARAEKRLKGKKAWKRHQNIAV